MNDTQNETANEQRHLAALAALVAEVETQLGLPTDVGTTRLMPCWFDDGDQMPDRHAEYHVEDAYPVGLVSDADVDQLAEDLGAHFTEDSSNESVLGRHRLVRFSGSRDGVTVFVSIRRDGDGTVHMSAETRCEP